MVSPDGKSLIESMPTAPNHMQAEAEKKGAYITACAERMDYSHYIEPAVLGASHLGSDDEIGLGSLVTGNDPGVVCVAG